MDGQEVGIVRSEKRGRGRPSRAARRAELDERYGSDRMEYMQLELGGKDPASLPEKEFAVSFHRLCREKGWRYPVS